MIEGGKMSLPDYIKKSTSHYIIQQSSLL